MECSETNGLGASRLSRGIEVLHEFEHVAAIPVYPSDCLVDQWIAGVRPPPVLCIRERLLRSLEAFKSKHDPSVSQTLAQRVETHRLFEMLEAKLGVIAADGLTKSGVNVRVIRRQSEGSLQ